MIDDTEEDLAAAMALYEHFIKGLALKFDGAVILAAHSMAMSQLLASTAKHFDMHPNEILPNWEEISEEIINGMYAMYEANVGSTTVQ